MLILQEYYNIIVKLIGYLVYSSLVEVDISSRSVPTTGQCLNDSKPIYRQHAFVKRSEREDVMYLPNITGLETPKLKFVSFNS